MDTNRTNETNRTDGIDDSSLAAAVPARGWNLDGLAATIETERHALRNPPLPLWLVESYGHTWMVLAQLAIDDLRTSIDPLVISTALAAVALARSATKLGALIGNLDESEVDDYLNEHMGWSERYRARLEPPSGARRDLGPDG